MHSVDSIDEAATVWDHGETGLPVAGPGAPLIAEFSVTEFAAAIGLPTETGKAYLGEAVELRYRLPRVWTRVVKGDLPAWRARRIARQTLLLTPEAAAHVDRHVAHTAHKIRPAQVDRLVEEAIGRFMPEEAERRRRQAADGRNFTINTNQPSLTGTSAVYGELDLADALDLDAAVTAGAQALKDLGSTDTLDVRRATAVGDLARRQLTLDLNPTPDTTPDASPDVGRAPDSRGRPASRGRWCSTCTSPTPPSPRAPRWRGSSGGSRTRGVRCTPNRSANGAATPTPTSPCNRSSTSTSTSTSRPTRSAAGSRNRPS